MGVKLGRHITGGTWAEGIGEKGAWGRYLGLKGTK